MRSGVYFILHLSSGRHYVGSACNLDRRWARHKSDFRAQRHHNLKLQNSWNKYGEGDFEFFVLELSERKALLDREQFWIDATLPFYNICRSAASPNLGRVFGREVRERMSIAAKKRYDALSDEEKCRLASEHSERLRGKKASDETRKKMSDSHRGKVFTEAQLSVLRSPPSPNASKASALAKAKTYIVTSPDGDEQTITNLSKFCRENNLSQGHMSAVALEKKCSHKGWTCRFPIQDTPASSH